MVAASSALSRTRTPVRGPDADGKAIWSHSRPDHCGSYGRLEALRLPSPLSSGSSCMDDPSLRAEPRPPDPAPRSHAWYIRWQHTTSHQRSWSVPSC